MQEQDCSESRPRYTHGAPEGIDRQESPPRHQDTKKRNKSRNSREGAYGSATVTHETTLISTVAVSLAFAFVGGLLAARLRLSPLIGYLVAGCPVAPFTPGFVADETLAPQLADIGVILLMFGVGMHFSLRDLIAVRGIAVTGAIAQIAVATALGMGIAHVWGWSLGAGLTFGLSLSVASTVVLVRALEAHGQLNTEDGRIAVGWLVVEDLVMVL